MQCRVTTWDRLALAFRRQGFAPSRSFLRSVVRRARRSSLGWSPRDFGMHFRRARHLRRVGPWGTVRLALLGGSAIAYRPSADGCRVMLLGYVRPDSRLWPGRGFDTPLREGDEDRPPRGSHSNRSGKSRKGVHEEGDRKRKRQQAAGDARDAQQKRRAALRKTTTAQSLTDKPRPTRADVEALIVAADARRSRVQRALDLANRIQDLTRASILEGERDRLIKRIQALRDLRLKL